MNEKINLANLWPKFNSLTIFPQTSDELSVLFVAIMLAVFAIFFVISSNGLLKTLQSIQWLSNLLKNETSSSVVKNREQLKEKAQKVKNEAGHLWLEFDKTLIEDTKADGLHLHNTLDASYFFNTTSLAGGITESRIIAAVPGFLTALGVIGTFIGLQLGMSELNISNDVAVDEMKDGLSHVISGASIAFMTSVWGVSLSVIFNFAEKILERIAKWKVLSVQNQIDRLFPHLSTDYQLQCIVQDGKQSRESLQGLAEKIGDKMQESLLEATGNIQTELNASLEKIMAPAINKLVEETSNGNQNALEGLVNKFIDSFGQQGDKQRQAMDEASLKVNSAFSGFSTAMGAFINKLEASESQSGEREKELVSAISLQVSELVNHANEQKSILTDFVEKQLNGLNSKFLERDKVALEQEQKRNQTFIDQTNTMKTSTDNLLQRIDENFSTQIEASQDLINQGKALQSSVDASIHASADATVRIKESAVELHSATKSLFLFSSKIQNTSTQLAEKVTGAVDSISDLSDKNQSNINLMENFRKNMVSNTENLVEVVDKIQSLINSADTTFIQMKNHQNDYLDGLNKNVNDLSLEMNKLLTNYAKQVNEQTSTRLNTWIQETTRYTSVMNQAIQALSSVVDEIESKLGKRR